jgi:hypothetical protein
MSDNTFQMQVLELHPMNQVPYHVGFSMGFLNVSLEQEIYCSATEVGKSNLWNQGWSDGRTQAEAQALQEAELYAAQDQVEEANGTAEQLMQGLDAGYSASTIYHVGTDETGRVIARGTRSTSDAHKDFHIMHAALEFSQAYELRGVAFPERQLGGLFIRPAVEQPKAEKPTTSADRVEVAAEPLRQVLTALTGPPHHIRELQATRKLPGTENPINQLILEFNAWFNSVGGAV